MEDLWWACMSVNLRAVRSSLAQVARTSGGRATRASGSTQEPAAKAARSATIDLSERDPLAGSTVLHFACNPAVGSQPRGHLLVLRLLLNHGAAEFINVQNNVGDTPLVVCARQGDSEGLQLLLEASADPSVKNRFGDTALHVAARLGHADLIASLLEWKGVDTGATNCLGKTAGQIANRRVRDLIVTAGSAEGKRTSTGGTPGPGDADEEIANHQTVQSSDSESEKMIGAGSTSHLGKNIGQVANRRACDIISTASVTTASESDGGQTAPVMSLAPAEASTPAAATPPAPAQTSPHSETTAWHAGAKPTSPKARKSSKTKEADKSPRAPRTTRSWTLAQVCAMHRSPSVGPDTSLHPHAVY